MSALHRALRMCCPLLALFGCAGTETGNPGNQVSLAVAARTSDETKVAVGDSNAELRVDRALISLTNIAVLPCSGQPGAQQGATIVDLSGTRARQLRLQATTSEACGLEFDVALPANDDGGLEQYSVLIDGVHSDGTPFEIRSQFEHQLILSSETPFDPHALILAFDLAVWLDPDEVRGAELHEGIAQIDDQVNPDVLTAIEGRLAFGAQLFVDADGDGELDSDEVEPVASFD